MTEMYWGRGKSKNLERRLPSLFTSQAARLRTGCERGGAPPSNGMREEEEEEEPGSASFTEHPQDLSVSLNTPRTS